MTQKPDNSRKILAVTAVAAPERTELPAELGEILASAGIGSMQLRVLSDGAVWQACEYVFDGGDEGVAEAVHAAVKGLEADVCVLPAANRRKRLLISDMDSTIIGQECLDELADFAGLKAEVSAITERAMRGELDFEGALTTRVAMLKGLELAALEAAYRERITLNPGARTLTATMKAHGAHAVLVSGGFTFFTSRVAGLSGFDAHRGNTLMDDGAALTGDVGRPILGREAKLSALDEASAAHGLVRDDALALGDGANDLDMIRAAGLGIAYHAKPIVAEQATAAISHADLTAALFFQGYAASEFVAG
ncbi:MAG: phosphoserine phosphatase [Hyphomonas sp. BRH_c22]|uniref:phosphoserine phosphatase SerB n=1 Tax=Hyphomonas sp. BRH_c22 TaxID=1629710 RepID=UPI00062004A6|nr:phosphoserine phosphatase SerB [Hyphomonas sp. BRH_c22]KJS36535.1 MAG: phosphoserine phosphatase [Hyphomonas sp. BRH_c22]